MNEFTRYVVRTKEENTRYLVTHKSRYGSTFNLSDCYAGDANKYFRVEDARRDMLKYLVDKKITAKDLEIAEIRFTEEIIDIIDSCPEEIEINLLNYGIRKDEAIKERITDILKKEYLVTPIDFKFNIVTEERPMFESFESNVDDSVPKMMMNIVYIKNIKWEK